MGITRNITRGITSDIVKSVLLGDDALPFISSWKTDNAGTSTSTQITIPTVSSGTYASTVDWGDGNVEYITTWNDARWTHTYSIAGTYTVKIYGTFTGFTFTNGGDKLKLLNISQWGIFKFGISESNFYGCTNLTITATDIPNVTGKTHFYEMFRGCSSITTIPNLGNWDTSSMENLQTTFFGCTNFNEPSIINLDVSSLLTFPFAFWNCPALNQPIPQNWDLISFTNISLQGAFGGTTNMDQDFSNWGQYINQTTNLTNFLSGSTLSTANFDATLIEWANYNWTDSLTPNFGNSKYSIGFATTSRFDLIANNSWTITDGGQSDANNILYLAASNLLKSTANPADGTAVSAWKDLTASAYSLDQATGANQPSFETNELNGQPVVMGNGTSDFLRDGFVELNSTDYTIIAVAKNNSAAPSTVQKIFELSNGTTTGLVDIRYLQTAGAMTFNSNGSTVGRAGILTIDYNIFAVYKSGSAIGFAVNSNAFATGIDSSTITGIDTLTVFGNRNGGQLLSGNIAELIIWKNAVSFEETTRVINYLSDKYGIEVTLV